MLQISKKVFVLLLLAITVLFVAFLVVNHRAVVRKQTIVVYEEDLYRAELEVELLEAYLEFLWDSLDINHDYLIETYFVEWLLENNPELLTELLELEKEQE